MTADNLVLRGNVIHVNEDGWVVLNLGAQAGVQPGQRFAVLGERRPRDIHDPFAPASPKGPRQPVLRADTAYELLRVILVESQCCVAISDRVPLERTPQPFAGPQGELLLYSPAPADWHYDALELEEAEPEEAPTAANKGVLVAEEDEADEEQASEEEDGAVESKDTPEEDPHDLISRQQERLWDGSLPLNAVQVGDEVILARPYVPGAWATSRAQPAHSPQVGEAGLTAPSSSDLTPSATYDWMQPS